MILKARFVQHQVDVEVAFSHSILLGNVRKISDLTLEASLKTGPLANFLDFFNSRKGHPLQYNTHLINSI